MQQGSGPREDVAVSAAVAMPIGTRLWDIVTGMIESMIESLRRAWHRMRAARVSRIREAMLLRQLSMLDARLLEDIGVPATRAAAGPPGSAMAAALDMDVRDRLQRQMASANLTAETAADAFDAVMSDAYASLPIAAPPAMAPTSDDGPGKCRRRMETMVSDPWASMRHGDSGATTWACVVRSAAVATPAR